MTPPKEIEIKTGFDSPIGVPTRTKSKVYTRPRKASRRCYLSSSPDIIEQELGRIRRKIHQAARLELALLNRSSELRTKRAYWTRQYCVLSQHMPANSPLTALPPQFLDNENNGADVTVHVSPQVTPETPDRPKLLGLGNL